MSGAWPYASDVVRAWLDTTDMCGRRFRDTMEASSKRANDDSQRAETEAALEAEAIRAERQRLSRLALADDAADTAADATPAAANRPRLAYLDLDGSDSSSASSGSDDSDSSESEAEGDQDSVSGAMNGDSAADSSRAGESPSSYKSDSDRPANHEQHSSDPDSSDAEQPRALGYMGGGGAASDSSSDDTSDDSSSSDEELPPRRRAPSRRVGAPGALGYMAGGADSSSDSSDSGSEGEGEGDVDELAPGTDADAGEAEAKGVDSGRADTGLYDNSLGESEPLRRMPSFERQLSDAAVGSPSRSSVPMLPAELSDVMNDVVESVKYMASRFDVGGCKDVALHQYARKVQGTWDIVKGRNKGDNDTPSFLFRDGPLTIAAKAAVPIVLEDFDQPSQAVMERINSMVEPSPVYSVTEDITNVDLGEALNADEVSLEPGFQVFATVHRSSELARVRISPATRSRFTEIAAHGWVVAVALPAPVRSSACDGLVTDNA